MTTEQDNFIDLLLACIYALQRNDQKVSGKNVKTLYRTFLDLRFQSRPLRSLDNFEFVQLKSLISRWKWIEDNKPIRVKKHLRLVVDNTKEVNGNV